MSTESDRETLTNLIRGALGRGTAREMADEIIASDLWRFRRSETASDDERDETTDENLWDFASDLLDAWNIEDTNAPSLSEDFRDRFVARFRRSKVLESSAEQTPEQCVSATCPVTTQHPFHERVFKIRPEPQGEPSDSVTGERT